MALRGQKEGKRQGRTIRTGLIWKRSPGDRNPENFG